MSFIKRNYAKIKKIFFAVNLAFTLLYLFVMAYSFSRPLRELIAQFTGNTIIVITVYFFLFYLMYFVAIFLIRYSEGIVIENIASGKKPNFKLWFKDLVNKEIITFTLLLVGVQVVYFFLETNVDSWWVPLSILCVCTLNAWEFLPNWVIPYFARHTDLKDKHLKERLQKLAQRAGYRFTRILTYKDNNAKAALFKERDGALLILSDIIYEYAPEEVEVLTALEIARIKNGYIWKNCFRDSASIFFMIFLVNLVFPYVCEYFGFQFTFDVETLPVLLGIFFIVFVLTWSILNNFKRKRAKQNDEYVLRLSQEPEAFISLIIRNSKRSEKKLKTSYFLEKLFSPNVLTSQRLMMAQDYAQNMLFELEYKKKRLSQEKEK